MTDTSPSKLLVMYPSGKAVKAEGVWHGPLSILGGGRVDVIGIDLTRPVTISDDQRLEAGSVLACDPRCVIVDLADLSVLYQPRMPTATIPEQLQRAMAADWPETAMRSIEEMKRKRRRP